MAEREPQLFKDWNMFMKVRQMRASSLVFKNHGWEEWQVGHAKLYGILLWYYERKKETVFKYSKILKRIGYRRTHNYRLLKGMVERELLQKEGNGYYRFVASEVPMIEKVLSTIKEQDMTGDETEVKRKWQSTASSEKTMRRSVKKGHAK